MKSLERKKEETKWHEEDFQTLIVKKLRQDLQNETITEPAVNLLIKTISDLIYGPKF